jgi:hypothetical protein
MKKLEPHCPVHRGVLMKESARQGFRVMFRCTMPGCYRVERVIQYPDAKKLYVVNGKRGRKQRITKKVGAVYQRGAKFVRNERLG